MSDDFVVEQVHAPRPECPDCRLFPMDLPLANVPASAYPKNRPKDVVGYDAYMCCGRILLMPIIQVRLRKKAPIPISPTATVDAALISRYRKGEVPEDAVDVQAWFGDGGNDPVGPLRAKAVLHEGGVLADLWICEEWFLESIGMEGEPFLFMPNCERLKPQGVRYDDYAWSPMPASRFDRESPV